MQQLCWTRQGRILRVALAVLQWRMQVFAGPNKAAGETAVSMSVGDTAATAAAHLP